MPMSVSEAEVQKIASLSRLLVEGDELKSLTKDFNGILNFVEQIKEVNTENVKPFDHVLGLENVQRDDTPQTSLTHDDIRAMAPRFEAGYFVVPRVIETE